MELEKRSSGRPAGEVRRALYNAAAELVTADKAPTMRELANKACVGVNTARRTVSNMVRAGQLQQVGERTVSHCSKQVAEYAPMGRPEHGVYAAGCVDFSGLTAAWSQR